MGLGTDAFWFVIEIEAWSTGLGLGDCCFKFGESFYGSSVVEFTDKLDIT